MLAYSFSQVYNRRLIAYANGSFETMYVVAVDHENGRWDAIYCKTEAQARAIVSLRVRRDALHEMATALPEKVPATPDPTVYEWDDDGPR